MYPLIGKRFAWPLLLLLVSSPLLAQFDVTYPVSRLVLQRDNANQASVQIAGSYAQSLDRIEAQVVPMVAGQGTGTAWTPIQTNPANGQFNGNLNVAGGWYKLRVRGLKNGQIIGTDSVERVGVGEVFAIFGHSNAQGSSCDNGDGNGDRCATIGGAADDRVICVGVDGSTPDYQQYERTGSSDYLPGLLFSKLNTFTGMSPFNKFAWCWGKLGDLLTARLNVPVLFYGAGFGGTNMEVAYKAAYNIPFSHPFIRYDLRMPYANTRTIMKLYVPSTGVRGFLLVHGENDRYDGNSPQQTRDLMKFYMQQVLAKMRAEFQRPKLAWVVAITSYPNPDGSNNNYLFPEIRQAQYDVLRETADTFTGPDLDQVRLPADRPDGVHYSTAAQVTVANLWNSALTDDFFRNSTPYLAQNQPLAALTCAPDAANQLTLTQPAGFGSYLWSTGASTQTIQAGMGTYSARLRRSMAGADSNVIFFPPAVTIPARVVPTQPTISFGTTPTVCGGESLTLTSSYATGFNIWSPSNSGTSITIQSAGTYYLRAVDPVYGCFSTAASQVISAGTADLSLSWQVSNRTPAIGAPLTYNLTVRNDGPCDVSNVVVQNRLPPNVSFESSPLFALMASTTDVLSGTIPSISRNTTVNYPYTARITAPGQYYNAIQITGSSSPDPDSQPGSGTADGQDDAATIDARTRDAGAGVFESPNPNQVPLPPVAGNQPTPNPNLADLSLSIRSSHRVASVGQSVEYTLTVSNRGGAAANNISVQDALPTGLQFVSGSAGVTANGATVMASIGQLAANSDVSLSFTVTVTGGNVIRNTAQITAASPADADSTPGNGITNGEDDTATTDLRVTGAGSGGE